MQAKVRSIFESTKEKGKKKSPARENYPYMFMCKKNGN